MKIIFLIDAYFSKRDYDRFGLNILLKNNIEVYCWDLYKLRHNALSNNGIEKDVFSGKIKYRVFENFDELSKSYGLADAFLIDQRSGIYKEHTTCWFQERGAIIIKLDQGLMPSSSQFLSMFDYLIILRNKLLNNGLKKTLTDVVRYIVNRFIIDSSSKDCYDIKVCSGSVSKCSDGKFEIRSHALDYDIFLQNCTERENHNQIVFLDSAMTGHPDDQKFSNPPACTEDVYYPLIRSFFDKVESQTGLSVIVSIHPRLVINDDVISNYGNREIVIGESFELIKGAKLILAHNSTAINFAVLQGVPLIIFTTNQIERKFYFFMESVSKILKIPRININNSYDNLDFFEIAQRPLSQYNKFVEKIIKVPGSPVQNSTEILIKGLKKYV